MAEFVYDILAPKDYSKQFKVVSAKNIEEIVGYPINTFDNSTLNSIPIHQRQAPFVMVTTGEVYVYMGTSTADGVWDQISNWERLSLASTTQTQGNPQGNASNSSQENPVDFNNITDGDWWLCTEDYSASGYTDFIASGDSDLKIGSVSNITENSWLWYNDSLGGFVLMSYSIDESVLSTLVGNMTFVDDSPDDTNTSLVGTYSDATQAIQALNNIVLYVATQLNNIISGSGTINASNVNDVTQGQSVQDTLDAHETAISGLQDDVAEASNGTYDDINKQKATKAFGGISLSYTLQGKTFTEIFGDLLAPYVSASLSSIVPVGVNSSYEVGEVISYNTISLAYSSDSDGVAPTKSSVTYPVGTGYTGPISTDPLELDGSTDVDVTGLSFTNNVEGSKIFTFDSKQGSTTFTTNFTYRYMYETTAAGTVPDATYLGGLSRNTRPSTTSYTTTGSQYIWLYFPDVWGIPNMTVGGFPYAYLDEGVVSGVDINGNLVDYRAIRSTEIQNGKITINFSW